MESVNVKQEHSVIMILPMLNHKNGLIQINPSVKNVTTLVKLVKMMESIVVKLVMLLKAEC